MEGMEDIDDTKKKIQLNSYDGVCTFIHLFTIHFVSIMGKEFPLHF